MDPDMNDIISFQELSLDKEIELEEEDELEEYITLDILEKPKHPKFLLRRLFPSKTGGAPAWLDWTCLQGSLLFVIFVKSLFTFFFRFMLQFLIKNLLSIECYMCFCAHPCHVFSKTSMSSGNTEKKILDEVCQCQLPRFNAFYSSEPPRRDGYDKPLSVGAALCSWCGTWKGEKVCSSCKRACYCSEKHQAMHWNSGHKIQCHQIICNLETNSSSVPREKPPDKVACSILWLEYEMVIEDECAYDLEASEDTSCEISSLVPKHVIDGAFQFLLDKFEADDNKKSWASFQERISKCPSQVLRYSRELMADPLWLLSIGRPSLVNIPKCKYCPNDKHSIAMEVGTESKMEVIVL